MTVLAPAPTDTRRPDLAASADPITQPTTTDHGPPPQPVETRPSSGGLRRWRNRAIVLLMVAAACLGAVQLTRSHVAASAKLNLGDVVLTSQPILVESAQSGFVTSVAVQAGDRVANGQRLGTIDVTTTDAQGHPVINHTVLRAPRAGVVVDDPVTVGSALQPGVEFVKIYDPADLRLVTTVPLSYLSRIRAGMSAELTAPGVSGEVTAVLQRAVPRVGTSDPDVPKGDLQLVFVAKDAAQVARLIPGLRFHGAIDTKTGSGQATPAQYVP
jgi:multidrug resistance efflux pump